MVDHLIVIKVLRNTDPNHWFIFGRIRNSSGFQKVVNPLKRSNTSLMTDINSGTLIAARMNF